MSEQAWKDVDPFAFRCVICAREIGAHGRYNHMMAHVRKGEARIKPLPPRSARILLSYHEPYQFQVKDEATK